MSSTSPLSLFCEFNLEVIKMKKIVISLLAPIFLLFVGVSFSDFKAKMIPDNFGIDGGGANDCYEIHYGDYCINVESAIHDTTNSSGCSGACDGNTSLTVSDNKNLRLDFYKEKVYYGSPVNSKLKITKLGNGTKVVEYYKDNNQGLKGWMWDENANTYFEGKGGGPIPLHPYQQ